MSLDTLQVPPSLGLTLVPTDPPFLEKIFLLMSAALLFLSSWIPVAWDLTLILQGHLAAAQ